ncbi:DUF1491 family protein [Oricola cellulosilytica]|uniref:DUF1491 family protein n=1 Tax=Oricola cellulosilytica TaxID=1429082 RepID=A0A4R0PC48_9HYPH|nr:DUF1491 family protein [Oricola cellulosilytica]TCD14103.1 DUF1491 family protein [Oricola cellulosilytica]
MNGRVTSAIFVSSIMRRVNAEGGFAAVLKRGSDDAGAIFLCMPGPRGNGTSLYGQAPQSVIAERQKTPFGGRLFELLGEALTDEDLAARFERETRMDPDFWAIEIDASGRSPEEFFDIA